MQNSQQHVALFSILLGLLEQGLLPVRALLLCINFTMKVKIFGELKDLFLFFPLQQITLETRLCCRQQCDKCRRYFSWFHKLVDWTLSHRWITWNTTNGYVPTILSNGQEITWALYELWWGNLWATLPALIINSRLKPFLSINNFLFFKCYKKQLCNVAIRQGVFLLVVGHRCCLTEQTVSL